MIQKKCQIIVPPVRKTYNVGCNCTRHDAARCGVNLGAECHIVFISFVEPAFMNSPGRSQSSGHVGATNVWSINTCA